VRDYEAEKDRRIHTAEKRLQPGLRLSLCEASYGWLLDCA